MDSYTLLKRKLLKFDYYKNRSEFKIDEYDDDELVFYWKCRKCEYGIITNCKDCLFDAFLWACINDKLNILKIMYNAGYRDIHQENNNALFWACRKGNLKVVKWLYSIGDYDFMTLVLCRSASHEEKQSKVWKFLNNIVCELYKKKENKKKIHVLFLVSSSESDG